MVGDRCCGGSHCKKCKQNEKGDRMKRKFYGRILGCCSVDQWVSKFGGLGLFRVCFCQATLPDGLLGCGGMTV